VKTESTQAKGIKAKKNRTTGSGRRKKKKNKSEGECRLRGHFGVRGGEPLQIWGSPGCGKAAISGKGTKVRPTRGEKSKGFANL